MSSGCSQYITKSQVQSHMRMSRHTDINSVRFAKPHARVWGIAVLRIFTICSEAKAVVLSLVIASAFVLIAGMSPVENTTVEEAPREVLINNGNHLVFSEVLFRENRSGEWIELYNPTNQTIDLEGFEIESDDGVSIYLSSGFTIAPGSYFTIVKRSDRSGFEKVHEIQADLYTGGLENLSDRKDRLRLFDPNGDEVDMVAWDKSGYRDFNVGRGNSIIRLNPNIDTDSDSDWDQGTPEGDPRTQASANQPPVASVNGPYSGVVGQAIAFSSAGTNDPDGSIVSYLWEFGDGATGVASNPNHTYSSPGTYSVRLTVTDNDGVQASETTSVEVISNTFRWSGSENGDWDNAGNWEGGIAPGIAPSKDIEIPFSANNPVLETSLHMSGVTLTLSDGVNLTISSSGLLTVENNAILSTQGSASVILNPGSSYVNRSASDPFLVVRQEITGNKGWRMFSSPFVLTYADMFGGTFVTQGFNGSDFPDLQPNLLFWDETSAGTTLQGWRSPGAITNSTVIGSGYFHYVFDGAGRPDSDLFYSDSLPLTISISGREGNSGLGFSFENLTYTPRQTADQNDETDRVFIDRIVADQGWNLIGNPTASTIDWDASGWTKENISETIYIWDPNANGGAGDYLVWNGSVGSLQDGRIAPMQAFWVNATGPDPMLSITNDVKVSSADFRGKSGQAQSASNQSTPSVKLTLSASGYEKGIWLSFSEKGRIGYDRWDAYELLPMSENWMTFNTTGGTEDGPGLVINHLPSEFTDDRTLLNLEMGLYENYLPGSTEFKLKWERTGSSSHQPNIYLQDHSLGVMYPIGADADSIRFFYRSPDRQSDMTAKDSKVDVMRPFTFPLGGKLVNNTRNCGDGDCDGSGREKSVNRSRFSILLSNSEVTDYLPSSPILQQNYPNPFNPETTISFSLPKESDVTLQIFDLLGREITTLADGVFGTGAHQVKWSAGSVSSGIYLYRMTINGQSAITRKMTVLK